MEDRKLEKKIEEAIYSTMPETDFDTILDACKRGSKKIVVLPKKKKHRILAFAPMAAALVFAVGAAVTYSNYANRAIYSVEMDVNPSISMSVNQQDEVTELNMNNAEAIAIVDDMDLEGVDINVAVNALLTSMVKQGYVSQEYNTILFSVAGEVGDRKLQEELVEDAKGVFETLQIEGAVLYQEIDEIESQIALAEDYNISQGKTSLIQQLIEDDEQLSFQDLSDLSISQLNLLAQSKDRDFDDEVIVEGVAAQSIYIGEAEALRIATENAAVSMEYILETEIEFDVEEGIFVYEIEFQTADVKFEYDIEAKTGAIIKVESERLDDGLDDDSNDDLEDDSDDDLEDDSDDDLDDDINDDLEDDSDDDLDDNSEDDLDDDLDDDSDDDLDDDMNDDLDDDNREVDTNDDSEDDRDDDVNDDDQEVEFDDSDDDVEENSEETERDLDDVEEDEEDDD